MKIFMRPDAGPQAAWPEGFEAFFKQRNASGQRQFQATVSEDRRISVPHGSSAAKVVFSVDGYLPEAWRVSAFHSDIVSEMKSFNAGQLPRADGIAVSGANFSHPLGISTADCLAVAVTSEGAHNFFAAGCFHAGWRGYTAGIQQNALVILRDIAAHPAKDSETWMRSLRVTIGPAICGQNYPCGHDVLGALKTHLEIRLRKLAGWSNELEHLFWSAVNARSGSSPSAKPEPDKIYPDLQALMLLELLACGLEQDQIAILREDTFLSPWWPSHRRAMTQGLEKAGRLVTHLCPPACP